MLIRSALCAALLIALAFPAQADPLKVVASFSILGDMVRQIGGDLVAVTTLVGPDGDAHVYQPTPGDAKSVAGADLIVVNGLGFEGWFDRLFTSAGGQAPVVVASVGIVPRPAVGDGHAHGEKGHHHDDKDHPGKGGAVDPHAWQDLGNGRRYVATIAAALARRDPAHAATFEANAVAYDRRLAELDGWVRGQVAEVPPERRKIITSHDAFGYLAAAYGIEILAPMGVSTEAEPTARQVAALIRQMKARDVHAVFIETMTDPRLIRQIARDGGGVVGGALYSDSLSASDGPAASYEAMFRHNIGAIVAALRS